MGTALKVSIWGKTVGYLSWDTRNKISIFEYDTDFVNSGLEIAPLTMPLFSPRSKGGQWYGHRDSLFHGLSPAFADSLPDKWGESLFRKWCSEQALSMKQVTPLEHLAFIGKRGIGALEYEPAMLLGDEAAFTVDIQELYTFSQRCTQQLEKVVLTPQQGILWQGLVKVSSSPGGKHPKAIIAMNESGNVISGQGTIPDGYTPYIIKYDGGDAYPYARLEYVFYQMACASGITMMPSMLRQYGTTTHFLTRRFDRVGNKKLHLQTLAAMSPLADSYEDAFAVLRKLNCSAEEHQQLFRIMVFNVLCGNTDDHNKNLSFIMTPDDHWQLAPAYDLTFSVDFHALPLFNRHELTVCGKDHDISQDNLLKVGQDNDVPEPQACLEQVCQAASQFRQLAADQAIDTSLARQIAQYIDSNIA